MRHSRSYTVEVTGWDLGFWGTGSGHFPLPQEKEMVQCFFFYKTGPLLLYWLPFVQWLVNKHINTKNHFLGNLLKNTLPTTFILALSNSDTQPSGNSSISSDLPKPLASLLLYMLYPRICTADFFRSDLLLPYITSCIDAM